MSNNYKNNALREFSEFSKQFPEYSVGEILYSTIRMMSVSKLSELLDKTDEEVYTSINKAIESEKEVI